MNLDSQLFHVDFNDVGFEIEDERERERVTVIEVSFPRLDPVSQDA